MLEKSVSNVRVTKIESQYQLGITRRNSFKNYGCDFFAVNWKLPAHTGAFLLKIDIVAFLLTLGALSLTFVAFL